MSYHYQHLTPSAARAFLHGQAGELSDAAVVLVAALLRLGPPGGAVAATPSNVANEAGDVPGAPWSRATRPEHSSEVEAASAADEAFRAVGRLIGNPLPPTHKV